MLVNIHCNRSDRTRYTEITPRQFKLMRTLRSLFGSGVFLACGLMLAAQSSTPDTAAQLPPQRFSLVAGMSASPTSGEQPYEFDWTAGYAINPHLSLSAGLPLFLVRASAGSTSTNGVSSTNSSLSRGLGDAFLGLSLQFGDDALKSTTALTGSAPTGDTNAGLSTGRPGFDINEKLEHSLGILTPFISAGFSNNTVDSHHRVRAYSTLGKMAQFEGGAELGLGDKTTLGASYYDYEPFGQQKVYSRLIKKHGTGSASGEAEPLFGLSYAAGGNGVSAKSKSKHARVFRRSSVTVGGPSIARDNGINSFLDYTPTKYLDLGIGYSRSIYQSANTVTFSVSWNVWALMHPSVVR